MTGEKFSEKYKFLYEKPTILKGEKEYGRNENQLEILEELDR